MPACLPLCLCFFSIFLKILCFTWVKISHLHNKSCVSVVILPEVLFLIKWISILSTNVILSELISSVIPWWWMHYKYWWLMIFFHYYYEYEINIYITTQIINRTLWQIHICRKILYLTCVPFGVDTYHLGTTALTNELCLKREAIA